jgi:hypothetical protein
VQKKIMDQERRIGEDRRRSNFFTYMSRDRRKIEKDRRIVSDIEKFEELTLVELISKVKFYM